MPSNLAFAESFGSKLCPTEPIAPLQVFSTCPSSLTTPDDYISRVASVARWSEQAGCTGILVYTDNSLVDPWLTSQIIIQSTQSLCPLVAVQPVYLHPYIVAKMVSTFGFLYGRRVFLNMVAGGFKKDLEALNDSTPHDKRYDRLVECTQLIQCLLQGRTVTFAGTYYQVNNLALSPKLSPQLLPGFLMSGSSDAGMEAAKKTGATAVEYPEPPGRKRPDTHNRDTSLGIRIGILARPGTDEAWSVALNRFPEDRKGQLTRQVATKVSDSTWHHRISELAADSSLSDDGKPRDTYWLRPFENYQSNCPYLVGSYDDVAEVLASYVALGYRTFILDIPADELEFEHIGTAFQSTTRRVRP